MSANSNMPTNNTAINMPFNMSSASSNSNLLNNDNNNSNSSMSSNKNNPGNIKVQNNHDVPVNKTLPRNINVPINKIMPNSNVPINNSMHMQSSSINKNIPLMNNSLPSANVPINTSNNVQSSSNNKSIPPSNKTVLNNNSVTSNSNFQSNKIIPPNSKTINKIIPQNNKIMPTNNRVSNFQSNYIAPNSSNVQSNYNAPSSGNVQSNNNYLQTSTTMLNSNNARNSSSMQNSIQSGSNMPRNNYMQTNKRNKNRKNTGAATEANEKHSFTSWTYERPCTEMEWNKISNLKLLVNSSKAIARVELGQLEISDLVLIGVYAPSSERDEKKDEDRSVQGSVTSHDEQQQNEEEDTQVDGSESALLTGIGKEIDDNILGGTLTELINENVDTFKNGTIVGAVTPTLRIVVNGKTRRYAAVGLGEAPTKEEFMKVKKIRIQKKKAASRRNGNFEDEDESDDDGINIDYKEIKELEQQQLATALGHLIIDKCAGEKIVSSCSLLLPVGIGSSLLLPKDFFKFLSISFYTTLYSDNRYRTKSFQVHAAEGLQRVMVYLTSSTMDEANKISDVASPGVKHGRVIASGIYLARDIVNSPHNVLNSIGLANTARRIVDECVNGKFTCEILDSKDCESRGMGAYLSVARGSETPPQFIHLKYRHTTPHKLGEKKPKMTRLAFIGKGVMFDTGGYNIKESMTDFKKLDCAGAASVLGAARILSQIPLENWSELPKNVEVHFIVAACDNIINEKAYLPGDIVTASNGKTIEIINTNDAEGRISLADALVYADIGECKCEKIIELSTLTSGTMNTLGKIYGGFFTGNEKLAKEIKEASKSSNEKLWRLPIVQEYRVYLKSSIADIQNVGKKYGSYSTAALFLESFINDLGKTAFAHLDIAGPVWDEESETATGYGPKFILDLIQDQNNFKK